jgi:hypothetical protein
MRWPVVAAFVGAVVSAVVAGGCSARRDAAPRVAPRDASPVSAAAYDAGLGTACTQEAFAETVSVEEASGSALMSIDGADALVVAGDSGNRGAYVIVDPVTGAEREAGRLPLGKRKDVDLEGLAVRDGELYGITSPGFMLRWKRTGGAFVLVEGPYPLGDPADGYVCGENDVNCGKNYEGVCLRSGAVPDGECVGLAASKTDGTLYCLALDALGRLIVSSRGIHVARSTTLTGCDLAPDGSVWAGCNLFGQSMVYRITDWAKPEAATVVEIGPYGAGFSESIAVGPDDTMYRFSDVPLGGPSAAAKFRCPDAGR